MLEIYENDFFFYSGCHLRSSIFFSAQYMVARRIIEAFHLMQFAFMYV